MRSTQIKTSQHVMCWSRCLLSKFIPYFQVNEMSCKFLRFRLYIFLRGLKVLNWVKINFTISFSHLAKVTMSSIVLMVIVSFILILFAAVTSAKPGPQIYYRDYKGMGCPEFDQSETVHLPHPYFCSKYLTCLSKSVLEQTCPGKLHWNIEKNMCDYPDPSKCVDTNSDDYNDQTHNRLARRSRFNVYEV